MVLLRVSATSEPAKIAGAIAGLIRDGESPELQCVGAAAINQCIKAAAIARGYLAPVGIDPVCIPSFQDIEINGEVRTAIRILVEPR